MRWWFLTGQGEGPGVAAVEFQAGVGKSRLCVRKHMDDTDCKDDASCAAVMTASFSKTTLLLWCCASCLPCQTARSAATDLVVW